MSTDYKIPAFAGMPGGSEYRIPAFAGMTGGSEYRIPAFAGMTAFSENTITTPLRVWLCTKSWILCSAQNDGGDKNLIPAFAGMTGGSEYRIPAFAGMTAFSENTITTPLRVWLCTKSWILRSAQNDGGDKNLIPAFAGMTAFSENTITTPLRVWLYSEYEIPACASQYFVNAGMTVGTASNSPSKKRGSGGVSKNKMSKQNNQRHRNKMQKIYYNSKLTGYASKLRKNPTNAEKALWYSLRGKQIKGYQFKRQKPIGEFIYDFYCFGLKLVIEIDGATHIQPEVQMNDRTKDEFIRSIGFHILRFTDDEVLGMSDYAVKKIIEYAEEFEKMKTGV